MLAAPPMPPAESLEKIAIALASLDARLDRIEAKINEYEPLIEMVRQRADRGSVFRRKGGG